MHKRFPNRPLALCLGIMSFFCLVLLILYHFAERENTLLKTAGEARFFILAAGEAEAAVRAIEEGAPAAVIYHKLSAAADHLSMAPHTEKTEAMTAALREAGEKLLAGEAPDEDTAALLTGLLNRRMPTRERALPPETPAQEKAETVSVQVLRERVNLLTGTEGLLHPAEGNSSVYVCRNIYVRLDEGGIPVELAVYPPMRYAPAYDGRSCQLTSARLLEKVLPGFYARPGGTEPVWEEVGETVYRARYRWREREIETTVRRDTGRLVGMRITPAPQAPAG